MLFANPAGRDDAPGREREGRPENRLRHEDALGMVPQRPVPEVGRDLLALVEPGMHQMKSSTVPPHFFTEDRAWW